MYYFDMQGWLTAEVIPDRCTDIAPPTDIPEGKAANFTGYKWILLDKPQPAPVLDRDEIRAKLAEIDQKKVRAITDALLSGDLSRLRQLEDEAATLRALL